MKKKRDIILLLILGTSVFIQVILLFFPIFFNDFYRYLWDGKLIVNSLNPFSFTPITADLFHPEKMLTDVWYWKSLHFKQFHSVYGPGLQLIFGLGALIKQDSVLVLKFLFFLFNIGSLGLGIKVLDLVGKNRRLIGWLALNPLWLFETMVTVHTESVLIFFFMLTMYAYYKSKPVLGGVSFGFLVVTKYFPILLLPLFFMHSLKKTKGCMKKIGTLIFCTKKLFFVFLFLTVFILYLPFLVTSGNPIYLITSLGLFSTDWVMSPGLFDLVWRPLRRFMDYDSSLRLTKIIFLPIIFYFVYRIYFWYQKSEKLFDAIYYLFILLIFSSSVIFSWYILWLVMLLPFVRYKLPGLILSFTIFSQYLIIYYDRMDNTHKYLENGLVGWNQLLIWTIPIFSLTYIILRNKINNRLNDS